MATQTITVNNAAELNQALSNATGGETILLAAGDYGNLSLKGQQYASNVTIKSADANSMASFSGLRLDQVSNLSFDAIEFDYTFKSGDANHTSPFKISNSSNISIDKSIFDGDFASGTGTTADGTGYGRGLLISGSTNVDVTNTEFHSWWKALAATKSDDLNFSGNNIHTIRSDGISLGEVQNVLIENNYIHDFGAAAGSGDHRDMIQIQRSNGTGSSDIVIRNNVLDKGAGDLTQSIWAGGDKANYSDPTHWNYNILIEGNIIYNAQANGIGMYLADGLTITNNTLIAVPSTQTGGVAIPKIGANGSKNVTIEYNVTSAIIGHNGQADWSVQNNVYIQNTDPTKPSYYDAQFVYHATAAADGYNQFGVIPGSAVDQLGAGSDLVDNYPFDYNSWVGSSSTTVGGTGTTGTGGTGTTDTGGTGTTDTGGTGTTDTGGTGTTDTGGTGTTDTGGTGTTDTGGTGTTDTGGTGTTDTGGTGTTDTGGTGGTQGPMVFDDFVLDIAGLPGNGQAQLKGDATVVDTASGPAIQFDGHRDQVKIGRLREFENSEQLAFTVEFTRDKADGSQQRLIWNKEHVGLTVYKDGLKAHVKNNDGKFHEGFIAKNLGLNDTETHEITLMVDQVSDRLQVLVDGQVVLDETNTDFDFVGGREWGWDLGFQYNRHIDGQVSSFAIDDEVQFVDVMGSAGADLFG